MQSNRQLPKRDPRKRRMFDFEYKRCMRTLDTNLHVQHDSLGRSTLDIDSCMNHNEHTLQQGLGSLGQELVLVGMGEVQGLDMGVGVGKDQGNLGRRDRDRVLGRDLDKAQGVDLELDMDADLELPV